MRNQHLQIAYLFFFLRKSVRKQKNPAPNLRSNVKNTFYNLAMNSCVQLSQNCVLQQILILILRLTRIKKLNFAN